jgi:hypothetical protein
LISFGPAGALNPTAIPAIIASHQKRIQSLHQNHAALRALAFKWQRILFRCWQDGVAYDESKYIASLRKRNSPLGAWLPE